MARSLTIQQEESASTTPLLTGFLLLAVSLLLVGAVFGSIGGGPSPVESPVVNTTP